MNERSLALREALSARPDDLKLREETALVLTHEGHHAEAAALLTACWINLTEHTSGPLPCLCKSCLVPELGDASNEERRYLRGFAISERQVLFYWLPEELSDARDAARRSVTGVMQSRRHRPSKERTRR